MRFKEIKQRIRSLPEVAAWPNMTDLVERLAYRETRSIWDYPVAACESVGGRIDDAVPGSAAILCSLLSIHLVDDILDEEPAGVYRSLGAGPAANMALAFQAAAHRILGSANVTPETHAALQASLARMALATAFGQNLDTMPLDSEEEYWRVVEAKTPPLFEAALTIGALLGGAQPRLAEEVGRLGRLLGRLVQVSDDLSDVLKTPAGSDWQRPGNSLPILFASKAHHPERSEFQRLLPRVSEPAALNAAQAILIRSGALSYCALKLVETSREARTLLDRLPLRKRDPLDLLLSTHEKPISRLFELAGADAIALEPVER